MSVLEGILRNSWATLRVSLTALLPPSVHFKLRGRAAATRMRAAANAYVFCGYWLESGVNDLQETFGCQFTNAPFGLSFHAHTCSV